MTTPGDYIPLHWEEDPDYEVVRGHVDDETFLLAVGAGNGNYGRLPQLAKPERRWARWSFDGCDEFGNQRRKLRVHNAPGRGRFPVTVADVTGWEEVEPCCIGKCMFAKGHVGGCVAWGST